MFYTLLLPLDIVFWPQMFHAHLDVAGVTAVPEAGARVSLQHAVHPLLQTAHPLAHGPPLLLDLLCLLLQLSCDVEQMTLSVLHLQGPSLQGLPLRLQPLALPPQIRCGAVEGFELDENIPHLDLGFVHVLLQVLAQLEEPVGDYIDVIPRCVLGTLLLGPTSLGASFPLKRKRSGHEQREAESQSCQCGLHG